MSDQANVEAKGWVIYPLGSRPKMGLAILLGIQQYLTMFGATVLIPIIVGGGMGMPTDQLALLISTIFFVSGLCTLIQQSPIGNRLPIIQGGTFSFLGPTFAIIGMVSAQNLGWQVSVQQICAAIMFASVFEIVLGYTGLMGYIKRAISPIAIAPTIAMIGLALYYLGVPTMAGNWAVSLITLAALILYSQIFARRSRVFLLFPVLLAIITGWLAALIGTAAGWIPEGNAANLTPGLASIKAAPWINWRVVVPFKWGFPKLNSITVAGSFGMLAGYLASMIESIGDYYSAARISEAPVPTEKMITRGLGAEGLGCLIASIFQTCNGTTSYSENIGAIGLTRTASRRVIRAGAVVMLIIPFVGKFGAALATMPGPVVGAMYVGLFGMIASVGLSNLQFVNLNNARNLFIIGISFFAGLSFPQLFNANVNPNAYMIAWAEKGVLKVLGDIVQAIFMSGMSVTAIIAIFLDNVIPGASRKERGLEVWEREATEEAWEKAEAEWKQMAVGQERKVIIE
jgi:xanthine/uracil permease